MPLVVLVGCSCKRSTSSRCVLIARHSAYSPGSGPGFGPGAGGGHERMTDSNLALSAAETFTGHTPATACSWWAASVSRAGRCCKRPDCCSCCARAAVSLVLLLVWAAAGSPPECTMPAVLQCDMDSSSMYAASTAHAALQKWPVAASWLHCFHSFRGTCTAAPVHSSRPAVVSVVYCPGGIMRFILIGTYRARSL